MKYLIYEKEKENDKTAQVELIYEIQPPKEFEGKYIEVEEMPNKEERFSKDAVLCINLKTRQPFYKYVDREIIIKEENSILKSRIDLMQKALDDIAMGGII